MQAQAQPLLFSADSIVDTVREPLLVLSAGLRVRKANQSFYRNPKMTNPLLKQPDDSPANKDEREPDRPEPEPGNAPAREPGNAPAREPGNTWGTPEAEHPPRREECMVYDPDFLPSR